MPTQKIDSWILNSFKWYLGGIFCFIVFVLFTQKDPILLPDSFCGPVPYDDSNYENIIQEGPNGFTALCEACHSQKRKDGFPLSLLKERLQNWNEFPREDLRNFIRNSQLLISQDHYLAKASWEKWKPATMPNFNYLTDQEIDRLIAFIQENG